MLPLSLCIRGLHPALRLAIVFWLVFGVAVSVRTLLRPETHTIFPVLASSSWHYWNNQSLYAKYYLLDYYRYPPGLAVALTPLSSLGLTAGGIVWGWLNLGIYGWGLWRLRRDVLPGEWTAPREALFLMLSLVGALRGLWNNQSNALAVGLLLIAVAALVRRRWWRAAFLLALPVLVKLTPLVPALLLCALWPRKLTGRFLLALTVGLLLPFATKAPDAVLSDYRDWFAHLFGSSNERWPGFRDAWTVWQATRHVLFGNAIVLDEPMGHPLPYRLLQVTTGLGVLAWCCWQQRRGIEMRTLVTVTLAMGMAWLMLFGPAVEHATYVFLAPVLAWAALQRSSGRLQPLLGVVMALILLLSWGQLSHWWPAAEPLLLTALPVGTMLFAAWLCVYVAELPVCQPVAAKVPWSLQFVDYPRRRKAVLPQVSQRRAA